jgi:hypothetical protein
VLQDSCKSFLIYFCCFGAVVGGFVQTLVCFWKNFVEENKKRINFLGAPGSGLVALTMMYQIFFPSYGDPVIQAFKSHLITVRRYNVDFRRRLTGDFDSKIYGKVGIGRNWRSLSFQFPLHYL